MSGYIRDRWLWLGLCLSFAGLYAFQATIVARMEAKLIKANEESEEREDDDKQQRPAISESTSVSLEK